MERAETRYRKYDALDKICNSSPSDANVQTAEKALGLMKQYKYLVLLS